MQQTVTTPAGKVKIVIAPTAAALAQAVATAQAEAPFVPNINNPADGNKKANGTK